MKNILFLCAVIFMLGSCNSQNSKKDNATPGEKIDNIMESNKVQNAKEKVNDALNNAKEGAEEVIDTVKTAAKEAADKIKEGAQKAKEKVNDITK